MRESNFELLLMLSLLLLLLLLLLVQSWSIGNETQFT
jgi:hypothetical protein